MKNTIKTLIFLAIFAVAACAQTVTLSSTTLSAAVTGAVGSNGTTTLQTSITLGSTTGMAAPSPFNQVNTILYVDKEVMFVKSVPSSGTVVVTRGAGTGAGAVIRAHASGALVYFANTSTLGSGPAAVVIPATRFIRLEQPNAEPTGTCTAANELVLPLIYSFSGNVYQCPSSGGQWININDGAIGTSPGRTVSSFCTGSLGSAETEYLNGAACSGATTATFSSVVATYGTIYGLYVNAGTAVTGGTSKDVLTLYKNGSATTITCTMAASATTCSDTTHAVSTIPGDYLQFKWVTATSDAGANVSASVTIF